MTPASEIRAARRIAVEAGDFLRAGRARTIGFKSGEGNLVTDMDRRAEERIVRALARAFPGDEIRAEEGGGRATGSDRVWHVDPLDGTANYAHGFPFWCVSIGLEAAGRLEAGVVYHPVAGDLYEAARGRGARRNRRAIRVTRTRRLANAMLVTGFPYRADLKRRNLRHFAAMIPKARAIRRVGSAALDLCCVAAGVFDGFWEIGLRPWDLAAGVLICREAGAAVTDLAGRPPDLERGEVLAANPALHRAMRAVLTGSAGGLRASKAGPP